MFSSRKTAPGVKAAPFVMAGYEKPQGLKPGQMNRGNYPMMPEHKRRGPFTLGMVSTQRSIPSTTKATRQPIHKPPGRKMYSGRSHRPKENRICTNPIPKGLHVRIQEMVAEAKKIKLAAKKNPDRLFANVNSLMSRYPHIHPQIRALFPHVAI